MCHLYGVSTVCVCGISMHSVYYGVLCVSMVWFMGCNVWIYGTVYV